MIIIFCGCVVGRFEFKVVYSYDTSITSRFNLTYTYEKVEFRLNKAEVIRSQTRIEHVITTSNASKNKLQVVEYFF